MSEMRTPRQPVGVATDSLPGPELPLVLATTAAVMATYGSELDRHDDYVAMRSPQLPGHFFGEALFVTATGAVDDADRWVQTYSSHFPDRRFPVIGLPREPVAEAWTGRRTEALDERSLVLAPHRWTALRSRAPLRSRLLSPEYLIREVRTEAQGTSLAQLEGDDDFTARLRACKMRAVQRGEAAFFAALENEKPVATAGVVLCRTEQDIVGRVQDVLTSPGHRRRGLAGNLLRACDRWARDHGASSTVIVADPAREAITLYRELGYAVHSDAWMVLPSPRSSARHISQTSP